MKKSTKYFLISGGVLLLGLGAYFTFRPKKVEDNGLDPLEGAETNALTELDNTEGNNIIQIGDTLYPSGVYVNVRYDSFVNNGLIDNVLLVVDSPNAVGSVLEILTNENHTWYKVELNQELTDTAFGYVRADVVSKNI